MGVGTLMRRAVFLDRDGVLNRTLVIDGIPHPPATVEELELLPGVPDALRILAARGFMLLSSPISRTWRAVRRHARW